MAITLDGTNGILSPDFEPSSSTTPTNGLFLPTTNALGFATNSTERLRLDASGNLGLGVTPSGWSPGVSKAVQLSTGSIYTYSTDRVFFGQNVYINSSNSDTYVANGYASSYRQYAGTHAWYTAPSGTAGNAISFTQAMTLDASGNLGIGTSSPTRDAGTASVGISGGASKAASLDLYGPTGSSGRNYAIYTAATPNNGLQFYDLTAGSERARIDSSGNLLVGTTSAQARLTVWDTSTSLGTARIFKNAASTLSLPALILDKYDNNSTTSQVFQQFSINNQATASGQINANGASQAAFGSYSDARLKENITALPNQLASICDLKPSEFDYKDGSGHQIGFIAQEMQEVYPDVVGDGEDGMLTITGWSKTEARLVKAIQELTARLEALEAK